jgi:hypothetical protein
LLGIVSDSFGNEVVAFSEILLESVYKR